MLLTTTPVPSDAPYIGMSSSNNVAELIGMVIVLLLILAAAFYTTKFVGKFSMGQFRESNFNVIDTYRISPNKFLQIVKVTNKYILFSVSKDHVTYITELDESEVIMKDTNVKENISFKQILDKVRNKTQ